MDRTFTLSSMTLAGHPAYESEFSATADFNLHIERPEAGRIRVYQRTSASGNYDAVGDAHFRDGDLVLDFDFVGAIYPKSIKVVTEVMPNVAVVTFNA